MTEQTLWYGFIAVIILLYVRKLLINRSIPQYSPTELQQKLKETSDIVLLDVRTNQERMSGTIKGSIHIPLHELSRKLDELNKYKSKEIVCYCATGRRSLSAAAKLRKQKFSTASLKGGIAEWNFQNRH
ncbi:MAG: rhodanese-like domain-containing protein [Ignavibacteriales bacterium]|nr:rhodanese-like domain-containing protein [Ignavibacteriales bacterium]